MITVDRWIRLSSSIIVLSITALLLQAADGGNPTSPVHLPTTGPLRVGRENPRYFSDANGRTVYLTGAHTWNNFQDMGQTDPPEAFDFNRHLEFLERHEHNFIRLWRWELSVWNTAANGQEKPQMLIAAPQPYARTGPGLAFDGKPKFNLEVFDDNYFSRLRSRVAAARDRGIYVSVMLFEGWGLQFVPDAWKAHPFNPANNVNGVDGDANHDGRGIEIHTLAEPRITALQEAYVHQVIDTVGDLDNVLYEISNENHPPSTKWQYHMIRFIKDYEKRKQRQHPVGMTFQYKGGKNMDLFESPADWVSPNPQADGDYDYRENPPPAEGRKVVLNDTDHLWGIGGNVAWVWKSFTRGYNPLFMDPYDAKVLRQGADDQWENVRRALGATRRLADKINLPRLKPSTLIASTGYCLAAPGEEYVVFVPGGGDVTLDLSGRKGPFVAEWINPLDGTTTQSVMIEVRGRSTLSAPGPGDAVLYVRRGKK